MNETVRLLSYALCVVVGLGIGSRCGDLKIPPDVKALQDKLHVTEVAFDAYQQSSLTIVNTLTAHADSGWLKAKQQTALADQWHRATAIHATAVAEAKTAKDSIDALLQLTEAQAGENQALRTSNASLADALTDQVRASALLRAALDSALIREKEQRTVNAGLTKVIERGKAKGGCGLGGTVGWTVNTLGTGPGAAVGVTCMLPKIL